MPKKAVSVTLDEANVLWLKGRARISGGNVSDALQYLCRRDDQGVVGIVGLPLMTRDTDIIDSKAVKVLW